ncbi:MAG: DUF2946 domain-containing protein [Gammaproteobacteria bacterium]|nr:DUF2946 domain-containing protein [Gammaproteobacteria bacterium]
MHFVRAHRRLTSWLAMLVMVFGVLAPAVAQAMVASSDRADWVEVCSASGMLWVKADGSGAVDAGMDEPMSDASQHCPWCNLHGGAAGLPPVAHVAGFLDAPADPVPAFSRASEPSAVWAAPQARGPPLAS